MKMKRGYTKISNDRNGRRKFAIPLSRVFSWLTSFLFLGLFGIVTWNCALIFHYLHWFETAPLVPPIAASEAAHLHSILNQDFFYLDEGLASKVFASKDNKFVIKVFKEPTKKAKYQGNIPILNKLANYRKSLKIKKQHALGCITAYSFLSSKTGMIYYHMDKATGLSQIVKAFDKTGKELMIDLNEELYLVQKKIMCSRDFFEENISKNNRDEIENGITSLLTLVVNFHEHGIAMPDMKLLDNFGFAQGSAICIDVDSLFFHEKIQRKT